MNSDPFDAPSGDFDLGEGRGVALALAAWTCCALLASLLLLLALALLAPGDLEPLRVADEAMWRWAQAGRFPLIEAARSEGRRGLLAIAAAQTYGAFFVMACGGLYFFLLGLRSRRIRSWSDEVWIIGLSALCLSPMLLPELSVSTIDYAITSSWAGPEAASGRPEAGEHLEVGFQHGLYGADGLNSSMAPAVFLIERGFVAAFALAILALCCHDLGYRLREAAEEAGLLEEPVAQAADPQEPSPQPREPDPSDQPWGFGRRGSAGSPGGGAAPLSPESRACRLLGVRVGAGRREIERAYRAAMKRAHPDHGGSTEQAAALNAARDLLLRRR